MTLGSTNLATCDHFFYRPSFKDGYIRGVFPCSLPLGHLGPHLHWYENTDNPNYDNDKRLSERPERSDWLTEETFGKIPIVIEYRAKIAKMREAWLRTGVMPHFHEVAK